MRRPDGGVDASMFQALCTTLSLDDALDLIEIDRVANSWIAAAHRNSDKLAAKKAEIDRHVRDRGR